MNNEIKNPKTEVPTGLNLNDKDYLNELLSTLKEMCKNYALVMTEASCWTLYEQYKNIFLQYSKLQRDVYELTFKKGWYVQEKAEQNKIDKKLQTLTEEFNSLNG